MLLAMLLAAPVAAPAAMADAGADAQVSKGAPIPPDIQDMLDAAIASGSDSEVSVVAKYAVKAAPQSAKTINDTVTAWREAQTAAHEAKVEAADFLDLWSGKATLGGWMTTGNSRNIGLSAVVDLDREGLRWRHKLHLQADYQESFHRTTREHYLASYEPNYKVDERSYIYGSLQYESDRFLGYYSRYSTSVGAGYSVIKRPDMRLDLELGPAYRYTSFTDDTLENNLATRGSLDFKWKLSPTITVTQQANAYLERYNSTVTGTTALNAKLFGPLSAQLSYNVQYESMPPPGNLSTDTTSRAALVYTF
jgi:putative salt-induced outer membrane protein